jgi:hypothetical protein
VQEIEIELLKLKNYMAKLTVKTRFGTTPVTLLNDKDLSLTAKGLYGYLQSKPDEWDFSINGIASQCKEGQKAIRTAIKELETAGWLVRHNHQGEGGKWVCEYELQDTQLSENQRKVLQPYSRDGNTVKGMPIVGMPSTGMHSNIDISKIEKNIIINNNIKKTSNKFDAETYICSLDITEEMRNALAGLVENRKIKKTATTQTSINLMVKKLNDWYPSNISQQIACINQSVMNGWTGIFELKVGSKRLVQASLSNERYQSANDYTLGESERAMQGISGIVRENPLVYTKKQWNELVMRCEVEGKELVADPFEMKYAETRWGEGVQILN